MTALADLRTAELVGKFLTEANHAEPTPQTVRRAFSVTANWAWLIASGRKTIENRSTATPYRERVAITSTVSLAVYTDKALSNLECSDEIVDAINSGKSDPKNDRPLWVHGCIVGSVEIIGVAKYRHGADDPDKSRRYLFDEWLGAPLGDLPHDIYANGPYCWLLRGAKRYAKPIPVHGQLNIWGLSEAHQQLVAAAELETLDDMGVAPTLPDGYDLKRFCYL